MTPSEDQASSAYAALEEENRKLKTINRVLMDRVERQIDPEQGTAFSLFYSTVALDQSVSKRTEALTHLTRRLMHEIAERRQAEQALVEAKEAAEQANASKTDFLAAASHDLHQPLDAARLFLRQLRDEVPEPTVRALTERIDSALGTMDALLEALLEISKLDSGAWRCETVDFPIQPLLVRLAAEFEPQALSRGLRLRLVATDAVVRADRLLVERILRNLIGNAVRYTTRGGIVVGVRRRAGRLRIDVVDSGLGIPRDKWQAIFREFHQLGQQGGGKGLGLGLAIVERAARLIGAELDLDSVPGRGSRFSVLLPQGDPGRAAPQCAEVTQAKQPAAEAGRVLLIENDPAQRSALRNLLLGWGCAVEEAVSTTEALALAAFNPHVVIADYRLEGEDRGTRAIAALGEKLGRTVPALIISSDRSAELRAAVRDARHQFLSKPVAPSKLRAVLSFLLTAE